MKKTIFFFSLISILLIFNGCHKSRQIEKPNNLIAYNSMVDIMSETYIIESIIYFLPPDSDKINVTRSMYSELFKKKSITKEQFISSMNYYLADQKVAEKLLTEVQKDISQKRDNFIQSLEAEAPRNNDTLTNPQ